MLEVIIVTEHVGTRDVMHSTLMVCIVVDRVVDKEWVGILFSIKLMVFSEVCSNEITFSRLTQTIGLKHTACNHTMNGNTHHIH